MTAWLEGQGAPVFEIPLYRYLPPFDAQVQTLLNEILAGDIDAVAFTSNTRVRCLFSEAECCGQGNTLTTAFTDSVQAASVGSMTSAALQEAGVLHLDAPSTSG